MCVGDRSEVTIFQGVIRWSGTRCGKMGLDVRRCDANCSEL